MEMTGAQIVVESLIRENVTHVFGIPGGVILPIFDALYGSKLKMVLTRHEQGAAHMADGYARSTGRVGVCVATSGPGATNLTTGLATANMDSIPIVAITGQVHTELIGNDAFQEADATGVTRPVTKHNFMVKDVKDLSRVIREAFLLARTGRTGPVHVDVPVDVQKAKTEFVWPGTVKIRSYNPKTVGHPKQIQKAVQLINKAERPLLYIGGGAILSGASEEIRALSEKAQIPVTHTLMANGAFPYEHPNYVGILGMHGKYSANQAMQNCDVLVACGARFDDRVTGNVNAFSRHSKKIHIDIDPTNISKTVRADVPIVGDLKGVLKNMLDDVKSAKHEAWRKQIQEWEAKHPLTIKPNATTLQPQYLIQTLHRITKGEAIVSTGVGQNQMWTMQWYQCMTPRSFLTSGGLGTMGYGFPAAIGAKFGNPDRPVVCIDGDGSFQMTMTEMATAVHEGIKVIVIVLNNYSLGMVRQWQELFYKGRFSASDLLAMHGNDKDKSKLTYIPDFIKWAEAYGVKGIRVTKNEEIEDALKEALAAKTSVIIEAMVAPEEKVFPMVPGGASLDDIIVDMA
ncbi:MAG: biosynthetic-type acetolactate synthase large subunit [Elusimicrobia bacterium]|nr:biosynthetic-type acetolactate synthase large subunit [Candidatus Obscuribacterium magneticum]